MSAAHTPFTHTPTSNVRQDNTVEPTERTLLTLAPRWRERADELRAWGNAEGAARALERAADELEEELARRDEDVLTLPEAAEESGYSTDHLARLIRAGRIPNAGRHHAPRIRRADVPRKAGALPIESRTPMSREQIARSVIATLRKETA